MIVDRAAPTTMAATATPLTWFGVGVAIMPAAMAVAALSASASLHFYHLLYGRPAVQHFDEDQVPPLH